MTAAYLLMFVRYRGEAPNESAQTLAAMPNDDEHSIIHAVAL